jgi:hypothetical protein
MPPFLIGLLVFAVIGFCVMVYILMSRLLEGLRDNRLPIQSGPATVAAKRTLDVSSQYGKSYIRYVTFQMPDGSRQEFETHDRDSALVIELAEGDHGTLTWQGTRFKSFAPTRST